MKTLLAQLGNERFQARNRAMEELGRLDERIAPALRSALAMKPSVEVSRRIKMVLEKVAAPAGLSGVSARQLQACRGIEVLEWIGTSDARKVLEELSKQGARVQATEAQSALQRLAKQNNVPTP